jgi:hypothetical protein
LNQSIASVLIQPMSRGVDAAAVDQPFERPADPLRPSRGRRKPRPCMRQWLRKQQQDDH